MEQNKDKLMIIVFLLRFIIKKNPSNFDPLIHLKWVFKNYTIHQTHELPKNFQFLNGIWLILPLMATLPKNANLLWARGYRQQWCTMALHIIWNLIHPIYLKNGLLQCYLAPVGSFISTWQYNIMNTSMNGKGIKLSQSGNCVT